MRLLVADDDVADRKNVRRTLKTAGVACEIVEAVSAEEALEKLESGAVDCAILDYQMPGLNGLEAIERIRRTAPFLPIVMVTGGGDEMLATAAMKRGAADYLPKKRIEPQLLRSVLERAMERERYRAKVAAQREELESFARVLAHDFMEPIRSTGLAAALIGEALAEGRHADAVRHSQTVSRLSRMMKALVLDLRDHTRADTEEVIEEVELGDALGVAMEALRASIAERDARICWRGLPRVGGSRSQLSQLFQNLIANSIRYCDAPRPAIHVDAFREGANWIISVADNGVGVPEEYREKIFGRFTRLHKATEREGSGLGLATCRKIAERHGGAIWCESGAAEPDGSGGAVFRFRLPVLACESV